MKLIHRHLVYKKNIHQVYEEQNFITVNLHLKAAAPILHKDGRENKK
jgi:hypothetical protein